LPPLPQTKLVFGKPRCQTDFAISTVYLSIETANVRKGAVRGLAGFCCQQTNVAIWSKPTVWSQFGFSNVEFATRFTYPAFTLFTVSAIKSSRRFQTSSSNPLLRTRLDTVPFAPLKPSEAWRFPQALRPRIRRRKGIFH